MINKELELVIEATIKDAKIHAFRTLKCEVNQVERIRSEIREGKPLAKPMEESGFFPAMMIQMIAVGEETGKLDDMLLGVSDHLNSEVDYTIRNLSTLLEPMLLSV
ncbi:MAG: type II secretion system F family protein, partial [Deltaproteobacteria bacterium]